MMVDGCTHLIYGSLANGLDARVEWMFWFNRYVAGVHTPIGTVQNNAVAAVDQILANIEAGSPISIDLYRSPLNFDVTLPGTGQDDRLTTRFSVSLRVDGLRDPSVRVSARTGFAPADGGIQAATRFDVTVLAGIEISGGDSRLIPVPLLDPTQVILLPDQSVEVIFTPNP
jgi:hypothetical protein